MSIKDEIEEKLIKHFQPNFINVKNESHLHSVPKNFETHFRIELVSEKFLGLSLLKRHRLIQELLSQELSKIKACSLHTLTQQEWDKKNGQLNKSPNCAGAKE